MLTEDWKSLLALGGSLLDPDGCRVRAAQSAGDALEACRQHAASLDLLLLGLGLPGMGGRQRLVKTMGMNPKAKVPAASGCSAENIRQVLLDAKAKQVRAKSFR